MKLRLFFFVCVGVTCLILQVLFLNFFRHYTHVILANVIGFVLSAQVNFVLSYRITWRDSQRHRGRQLVATWARFNCVALGSACINGMAFATLRYTFVTVDELAAVAATFVSTAFTFAVNHFVVLKPVRQKNGSTTRNSNVPSSVE